MREYEEIVLGEWLNGLHLEDMALLEAKDFYPPNDRIFTGISKGLDWIQIRNFAKVESSRITGLATMGYGGMYRTAYNHFLRGKILKEITNLSNEGNPDIRAIKGKIDYLLEDHENIECEKDLSKRALLNLNERVNRKQVTYGLSKLDFMSGGIRRTELTTIGARPSVGKSALGLQIALKVAEQGQKVLFFPLEMSTEQTLERILCMKGYTTSDRIRKPKDVNWENFSVGAEYLDRLEETGNFKIYEGKGHLDHIRQAVRKEKPFLIVVDQLTQMRATKNFTSVRERFSHMTNNLKEMAMSEKIAVILLCQVNRDAQESEPTMANLKESGSIEEDSDNILLLHRIPKSAMDNPERWGNNRPVLMKLEKQRDGETGSFYSVFLTERFLFKVLEN